jgi:hypothetical protein
MIVAFWNSARFGFLAVIFSLYRESGMLFRD